MDVAADVETKVDFTADVETKLDFTADVEIKNETGFVGYSIEKMPEDESTCDPGSSAIDANVENFTPLENSVEVISADAPGNLLSVY